MKVFFLSYWFPYPPDNGARIRVYNFIKALAANHKVHLYALLQSDSDPKNVDILAQYCKIVSLHLKPKSQKSLKVFLGLFSNRPRLFFAGFDPILYDTIQKAIIKIKPDVIIVSEVEMAEYITRENPTIPSILIDHNCEFGVIQRRVRWMSSWSAKLRLELTWRKFASWEANTLKKFDRVVMPTEEDKGKMQQYDSTVKNIQVIPNAADTDYYSPANWSPESHVLLYNGALTYSPNLDSVLYFIEDIYPGLKNIFPDIQLLITGHYDNVNVDKILNCPGIILTGYVKDIREVLYRSAACIIPLRQGGGMRLKIPEAMAAGVPVVSTSLGIEGLECIHGKHLLIADTPVDFIAAITRLMEDKPLVNDIRKNARQLVEERYSWKTNAGRFVDLVESVAKNTNRKSLRNGVFDEN